MVAGLAALSAILLAGVGGWAYVEYWSGSWYQEPAGTAVTESEPPGQVAVNSTPPAPIAADPEPPGPAATEPALPGPAPVDAEPQGTAATEPEPPPPAAVDPEPQGPVTAEPEPPAAEKEIAALPKPPLPRFSAADIRDHVTGYDGGPCFFAFPADIGEGSAEIIGYGNQRRSFDALRSTFQARFGFDAAMEMRTVTDDQCVVVEALGQLTSQAAAPVSLDLSHGVLRSGRSLSGTISGLGDRKLALLMLDNFGFVHSLNGYVVREAGTARFEIKEMSTAKPMDFQPQLILAVASAQPLQSLALQRSLPARELFPTLLREIAGKPENLSTAVGYFMFGS
jgi:serine/threonine-protein kinase